MSALSTSGWRSDWMHLDGDTHFVEFACDRAPHRDGAPIVLVHGLSGSYANWLAVAPRLASTGRRVLALDLPGHGLTRPAGHDTTLPGLGRLLERFVDEVAGGRAVLVGNSLGGLLSAQLSARRPDAVESLVLIAPALPLGRSLAHPVTMLGFTAYAVPGLGEAVVTTRRRWSAERLVDQSLWLCCADPTTVPADVRARHVDLVLQREGYRLLEQAFLTTARSLLRTLASPRALAAELDRIQAPVLHLHGEQDKLVPVATARKLSSSRQGHVPQWTYVELPGVGHVPQLEAPERTADLLLDWLATAGRRPAMIAG
ncbi:MAG TPA: alpha/beta fold hydrolase [Actinomycetales bacterium]|nr:alpha/beta fold hydrolase [Actinomycetales bacterium]